MSGPRNATTARSRTISTGKSATNYSTPVEEVNKGYEDEEEYFTLTPTSPILKPPAKKKGPRQRTVVLSDAHFPFHDPRAWDIALCAVEDLSPDSLWILGDFLDLASLNGHKNTDVSENVTLRQEFEAGNHGLDLLDKAARSAGERFFFDGNHEWRLDRARADGRISGVLSDSIESVEKSLFLRQRGYTFVARDKQPCLIGDLHVMHGEYYNKHHAAKHLDLLGAKVLYGHTHTPQQFTTRTVHGNLTATGMPCLRSMVRNWVHQKNCHTWTQGFCVIEWNGKTAFPMNVYIHGGKAAYGGFRWPS